MHVFILDLGISKKNVFLHIKQPAVSKIWTKIGDLDEVLDKNSDFGCTKSVILDNAFLGCLTAVIYLFIS